ncbi:MAG: hydrogenase maturation nickel metallochaperone HypA, partial [Candidatus Lokiarchaeota archaeon]|nr:hydrogenase maturation nickel metallochaperone HypA [Candidatus Lokiarchaeota archaeon]
FGTAQQIVRTITRVGLQNGASKITAVHLEIGALTFLVPDQLKFSFDIASKGTIAEGARFEITRINAVLRCNKCGYEGEVDLDFSGDASEMEVNLTDCPKCDETGLEIIKGRELNIKNIKVET